MMIIGVVMILFILGLFFEALGSRPKSDSEWQNDTERESPSTSGVLEASVTATHV